MANKNGFEPGQLLSFEDIQKLNKSKYAKQLKTNMARDASKAKRDAAIDELLLSKTK